MHPGAAVSASPHAHPKYDAEVPRSWDSLRVPSHPTSVGGSLLCMAAAGRWAGLCPAALPTDPSTHHPRPPRSQDLTGVPNCPPLNPTERVCCCPYSSASTQAGPGCRGATVTPSPGAAPPPCPLRAAARSRARGCERQQHPQPQPGSLKVKRWWQGKPRCLLQPPHLPPRTATYGPGGDTGRLRAGWQQRGHPPRARRFPARLDFATGLLRLVRRSLQHPPVQREKFLAREEGREGFKADPAWDADTSGRR